MSTNPIGDNAGYRKARHYKALAARRAANHDPSQNPKSVDFTAWAARPEA